MLVQTSVVELDMKGKQQALGFTVEEELTDMDS